MRTDTFHSGDEFFLPVIVSGQDFVKPLQFGISAVVLLVQKQKFHMNVVLVAVLALKLQQ